MILYYLKIKEENLMQIFYRVILEKIMMKYLLSSGLLLV